MLLSLIAQNPFMTTEYIQHIKSLTNKHIQISGIKNKKLKLDSNFLLGFIGHMQEVEILHSVKSFNTDYLYKSVRSATRARMKHCPSV